jgi:hypothetical protein
LATSAARTPRSLARWRSIRTCSSGLFRLTLGSTSSRPGTLAIFAETCLASAAVGASSGPTMFARTGKKFSPPPSADGITTL